MLFLLHSLDTSLGRCDRDSLPQQSLMELLVEDVNESSQSQFRDKTGMYWDCCQWPLVICDDKKAIIEVMWWGLFSGGSIHLEYMPSSIVYFTGSNLSGTIDLTNLSAALEELDFTVMKGQGMNTLSGTLDLTSLPGRLEALRLSYNSFWGTVTLTQLPASLTELWLTDNALSGTVEIRNMPPGMLDMSLGDNSFHGIAVIDWVSDELCVNLSGNALEGVVDAQGNWLEPSEQLVLLESDE